MVWEMLLTTMVKELGRNILLICSANYPDDYEYIAMRSYELIEIWVSGGCNEDSLLELIQDLKFYAIY